MNRTASIGTDVFRSHVDRRQWVAIQKILRAAQDEQSLKLLDEIQWHFVERFDLKDAEERAWNRLRNMVHDGERWPADLLRNNVFKVANELGINLPSGMFASTSSSILEQEWGKPV